MGLNQRLIKLVCVASSLSTQQYRVRDKTGWLGIRIMCLMEETCRLLFQWASTIQTLQYMYAIINRSVDLFRISSTLHVNCIVALNMLQCSCKILVD